MRIQRVAIASICLWWTAGACIGSSPALAAETYALNGLPQAGSFDRVQVTLEVGGMLKVMSGTELKTLKMSVHSSQTFDERTIAPADSVGVIGGRTARYYDALETNIKIDEGGTSPGLRDDRKLIVADATNSELTLFSPQGPLTRAEVDLLEVAGGGQIFSAVLPRAPQAIGGTWQPPKEVWGPILGLDAVTIGDVSLVLTSVDKGQAILDGGGRVTGAVAGVGTDVELKIKALYDTSKKRLLQVAMAIRENRSIGHVGPGLDVVARVRWMITPIASSEHLTNTALKDVPLEPNAAVLALEHTIPDRMRFRHSREWYAMNEDEGGVILRWIHKGELLAQANVVAITPNKDGAMTLQTFQNGVKEGLGKSFGDFAELGEGTSESGLSVMRAVVGGQASELPIQWHYLLASDKAGRSAMFTFTLEQGLAELFAKSDWEMVDAAELIGKVPNPNEAPTPAAPPPNVFTPKTGPRVAPPPVPGTGVRAAASDAPNSARRPK